MQIIIDGDYNRDLVSEIRKKNLPVSHFIIHILQNPIDNSSIFLLRKIPSIKEFEEFTNVLHDHEIIPITGIEWDYEAEEFLHYVMTIIPKEMRNAAKKGIGFTAERIAEKKSHTQIDKELIIAIILELVLCPFKRDYIEFLEERDIDLLKIINQEEINFIKSLLYSLELIFQKESDEGLVIKNSITNKKSNQI